MRGMDFWDCFHDGRQVTPARELRYGFFSFGFASFACMLAMCYGSQERDVFCFEECVLLLTGFLWVNTPSVCCVCPCRSLQPLPRPWGQMIWGVDATSWAYPEPGRRVRSTEFLSWRRIPVEHLDVIGPTPGRATHEHAWSRYRRTGTRVHRGHRSGLARRF